MTIINELQNIVGIKNILYGSDANRYSSDWTGAYTFSPIAVVRPTSTQEVSEIAKACYRHNIPMVPLGGNTGLAGGTSGIYGVRPPTILSTMKFMTDKLTNALSRIVRR